MADFGTLFLEKVSPLIQQDQEAAQGFADIVNGAEKQGELNAVQPDKRKQKVTGFKQNIVSTISSPNMSGVK